MRGYNEDWIYNRAVVLQAERWQRQGLLTDEQGQKIQQQYPVGFRGSNTFLEIGAFLFTNIAVAGGYALLWLFLGQLFTNQYSSAVYNVLIGIGVGLLGQALIRKQQLYRSGVDNALIVSAVALLLMGLQLALPNETSLYARCLLSLPVMLVAIWFYGDTIVTCLAIITLYAAVFDGLLELSWGQAALPFVMMALSTMIYLFCHFSFIVPTSGPGRRAGVFSRTSGKAATQSPSSRMIKNLVYYDDAVTLTQWMALIALLASGNYYIVRELNGELLDPSLAEAPQIALPWLFWFTTFAIPVLYGYIALRYRNRVFLLLMGLGIAALVATLRYYIGFLPLSVHLALCGFALILIAFLLIRFLSRPGHAAESHGLTDTPDDDSPREFFLNVETLATIQASASLHQPEGVKFGGGDFGGGGAGATY